MSNQDSSFEQWMKEVDKELGERCGLGYMDLPDCSYRDWFDSGMDPIEAAEEVLEEVGLGFLGEEEE